MYNRARIFGLSWCFGDDSRLDRLLWFAHPFSSWSQKSLPGFALTGPVWSGPRLHEWRVSLRVQVAICLLQERILSCCHSPLAYWKSWSPWALPHNFQWQERKLFYLWKGWSEWQVNLVVIGIALGFWEVLFHDLEQVVNIDGEQNRAKAVSVGYSSGQLFLFWKSVFLIICTCCVFFR